MATEPVKLLLRISRPAFLLALALVGGCAVPQTEPARLDALPAQAVNLFDGHGLRGWTQVGGRYDGAARWTVEDGCITGRQGLGREGGLLYTRAPYANFEFECELRIDYPFDSGIFLRMQPPASDAGQGFQVTLDHRPGGEIGGIYSDGWLQHCPAGAERFREGEWNHVRVRCEGRAPKITTWLNGELLSHYAHPEETRGFAATGLLGLQVHGGEDVPLETRVQFRALRLVELPFDSEELFESDARGIQRLTHRGAAEGWRALLGDETLAAWEAVGTQEGYAFEEGVLTVPAEGHGYLRTQRDYRDFELRLEFQCGALANSGLFLRGARDESDPAYSGCELQILDDHGWEAATGSSLAPYQFTGSLYGAAPAPRPSLLAAPPRWNSLQVLFQGSHLEVHLNGVLVHDVDTHALAATPPFASRAREGFLGLQRHAPALAGTATQVRFRNAFVREL